MNNSLLKVVDSSNTEHYLWGDNCHGWHFVKSESLSVIKETMPPGTKEKLHYHEKALQFFYIISGIATFETDEQSYTVVQGKGITIRPGTRHRIINIEDTDLEFIVVSVPEAHGDRINIE
jgi:mannose-6-phosphate isomerase-like protein (cupin superfamily)